MGKKWCWLVYFFFLIQNEIKCSRVKEVKLTHTICLKLNETSSCVSQTPLPILSPSFSSQNYFWTSLRWILKGPSWVEVGQFNKDRLLWILSFGFKGVRGPIWWTKKAKMILFKFTFPVPLLYYIGFSGDSVVKNLPANAGDMGSIPESGRFPWRRKWQPTPVFWSGKSHGQRSLAGYSP